MCQLSGSTQAALDYNSTIIGALEVSEKKWVLDDWVRNYSEERPHQDRRLSNRSGGPDQTPDAVRQIKFQLLQSNSKA